MFERSVVRFVGRSSRDKRFASLKTRLAHRINDFIRENMCSELDMKNNAICTPLIPRLVGTPSRQAAGDDQGDTVSVAIISMGCGQVKNPSTP